MKRIAILAIMLSATGLGWQTIGVIVPAPSVADYSDEEARMRSLEQAVAASPEAAGPIRSLAMSYARAIYDASPLRAYAERSLGASGNVWVLSNTAYSLQSFYNEGLQRGTDRRDVAGLAERYFLRAKTMDPNLDRAAILPVIDLAAIERQREEERRESERREQRRKEAVSEIPRLPLSEFPQLPTAVRSVLATRSCSVPQSHATGAKMNVISGDFFGTGAVGWAVLCSDGTTTALLAFRNGNDPNPETLTVSQDLQWIQFESGTDKPFYAHDITVSERATMEERAKRYGLQEPARYDHVGIDVGIYEVASTVWYFDNGRWLQLPGAD